MKLLVQKSIKQVIKNPIESLLVFNKVEEGENVGQNYSISHSRDMGFNWRHFYSMLDFALDLKQWSFMSAV